MQNEIKTLEKPKERDSLFDNLKAVGIFLVVLGHMLELINTQPSNIIYKIIYIFHMPLFIFISGYFSKFNFKTMLKKFIIPFFVIHIVWTLVEYFITTPDSNFWIYFAKPRWIMWFLFAIIIWKLTVPILNKIKKLVPIIIILSFILGLGFGYLNFDGYLFSISRIVVYYPFFLLGYYFKQIKFRENKFFKSTAVSIILGTLSIIAIMLFFILFPSLPREAFYGSYMYNELSGYSILVRLGKYICSCIIILFLISLPSIKIPFLTNLGKYSFEIYLLHGLFVKLLGVWVGYTKTNSFLVMFIFSVLTTLICFALSKLYYFIIAKIKDKLKSKKQQKQIQAQQ